MQEVEAICDDVIIINKGKVVANDTLKTLKSRNQGKTLEDIFITLTNI
jgi:ABC-2 type transport system ATP-binding protein